MSWDDLLDLIATILVVWGLLALAVAVLVGKCIKHGKGPHDNEE